MGGQRKTVELIEMLFRELTRASSRNNLLVNEYFGATWLIRLNLQLYQLKGNNAYNSDSVYIYNQA